ncbi:MAG: AMP-binding protein [Bermanella sp.]
MSVNYLTPLDYLYQWEKKSPKKIYLRQPRNRVWQEYSWQQVADEARRMAAAMQALKVKKGDRVAIISKNCAEWIIADLAIMMVGGISVPLYPTQSDDSMAYVLQHSGACLVFVGKLDNPQHIQNIIPNTIKKVGFNYNGIKAPLMWNDLIAKYAPTTKPYHPTMADIFTIVYTSGTTGYPKGVVHDFAGASFAATHGVKTFNFDADKHSMSYLPLAHIAERVLVELPSIYAGFTVSFSESLATFAEDLRMVSPTSFFSVPRLWTKFQMGILEKMPQKKLNVLLSIPLVSSLVKRKIRQGLGLDNATMFISGAAPLAVSVLEWFGRLGINIQEGYGMSENLAYGTFNPVSDIRFGSVGKCFYQGQVKISHEGEILFKSPANMKGYYLDDEKTQEVFQDGFYCTGDKGEICSDGYLTITGRIKDTFKTSKGEFITPTIIEELLCENTNIEQVCVLGLGLPQPLALVVLSAQAQNRPNEEVTQELKATYLSVNKILKSHEVLNGLLVVKDEWLPENGLMTPTLKVKRNEVAEHYQALVTKYSEVKAVVWE